MLFSMGILHPCTVHRKFMLCFSMGILHESMYCTLEVYDLYLSMYCPHSLFPHVRGNKPTSLFEHGGTEIM